MAKGSGQKRLKLDHLSADVALGRRLSDRKRHLTRMSPRKVSVKEDRDGAERASEAHGLTRPCLEFAPRTQDELKKIYRQRPRRCLREKAESQDSEESEEEEEALTEEQFKQTEGYKLILNAFKTIAKKYGS